MLAISVPAAAPQRVTQNMCPDNHINIRKNVTDTETEKRTDTKLLLYTLPYECS